MTSGAEPSDVRSRRAVALLLELGLAALTLATAIVYLPDQLLVDDVYIYLRYAANLAAGEGLCYSPGDVVHGCTSVGYGFVLAVLHGVTGFDLLTVAALVQVAAAGWFGLSVRLLLGHGPMAPLGWLAAAFFVSRPTVVLCSGIDGMLFVATSTAALLACRRASSSWFGAAVAAACLLRPEGLGLAMVLAVDRTIRERALPWRAALVAAAPVAAWYGYATWRFGSPLPASAAAKLLHAQSGMWPTFGRDLVERVLPTQLGLPWLFASALAAVVLLVRDRSMLALLLGVGLMHNGALVWLGVPSYPWYYFTLLAQVAMLLALGGERLLGVVVRGRATEASLRCAACLAGALVLGAVVSTAPAWARRQTFWPNDLRPKADRYYALAEWLRHNAPPGASLATLEIGMLGYWSGLRIHDLCGLVTAGVAEHVPTGDHVHFVLTTMQSTFVLEHVPHGGMEAGMPELVRDHYRLVRSIDDCRLHQRLPPAAASRRALVEALAKEPPGVVAIADPWPSLDRAAWGAELAQAGWRLRADRGAADFVAFLQADDRWRVEPAQRLQPVVLEAERLASFQPFDAVPVRVGEGAGGDVGFVATGPLGCLVGDVVLAGPVVAITVRGRVFGDEAAPEGRTARLVCTTASRPTADPANAQDSLLAVRGDTFEVEFVLPGALVPADETLQRIFLAPVVGARPFRIDRIEFSRY
ncbi:MAG: hypothetical protein U1F60_02370 [Planctomycetota bacterium]